MDVPTKHFTVLNMAGETIAELDFKGDKTVRDLKAKVAGTLLYLVVE